MSQQGGWICFKWTVWTVFAVSDSEYMANCCFLDFTKKWRRHRCSTALTTLAIGIRKQNRARARVLLPAGPTISPLAGALAWPWPGQLASATQHLDTTRVTAPAKGCSQQAVWIRSPCLERKAFSSRHTCHTHTITPEDHTTTVSPFYSWAQKWPSVIEWKWHLERIGNQGSNSGTYLRLTDNSEPQQMSKCLIN